MIAIEYIKGKEQTYHGSAEGIFDDISIKSKH